MHLANALNSNGGIPTYGNDRNAGMTESASDLKVTCATFRSAQLDLSNAGKCYGNVLSLA